MDEDLYQVSVRWCENEYMLYLDEHMTALSPVIHNQCDPALMSHY